MKSLCSGSQTNAEYIDAEHLTGSTLLRRLFKEINLYNSLILATFCRSSRSGRLRQSTGAPNCRDPDARDPESRDPKTRKRESRRRKSKRRGRRGESPAALAAKTCPDIMRTPNEPSNGKYYHFTVPTERVCITCKPTSGRASWGPRRWPLHKPPGAQTNLWTVLLAPQTRASVQTSFPPANVHLKA